MVPSPPDRLVRLAALERRYDGPVPSCELPGASESLRWRIGGLHALHQRLAAAARTGAAGRRRRLTAAALPADSWLSRLTLTLAGHRSVAVALLENARRI
ncbi:MAG: hypothetical protein WCO00_11130 [Rhodospirillaceae bacterium]